jgi:hypothetical protein
MPVVKQKWIMRTDLKKNPEHLFVFGDNMARRGLGGQAKEMRGEPNAVGVPTKWEPSMFPSGFFVEADLEKVKPSIDVAFERLRAHLARGGTVVLPRDGLGTGLAQLDGRAPSIAALIQAHIDALDTVTKEEVNDDRAQDT